VLLVFWFVGFLTKGEMKGKTPLVPSLTPTPTPSPLFAHCRWLYTQSKKIEV
jgi:hypothetical protein